MASSSRVRRPTGGDDASHAGTASSRHVYSTSPRFEDEDGAGSPGEAAAAEVAQLSSWRLSSSRVAPPPHGGIPSPGNVGAEADAVEAAAALRQRFGLGPVSLAPAAPASSSARPPRSSARSPGGPSGLVDAGSAAAPVGGASFAELQAALNEKTREAERLQELLLAVTPAPGVVPSKLADIQVRGGRGFRLRLSTRGRMCFACSADLPPPLAPGPAYPNHNIRLIPCPPVGWQARSKWPAARSARLEDSRPQPRHSQGEEGRWRGCLLPSPHRTTTTTCRPRCMQPRSRRSRGASRRTWRNSRPLWPPLLLQAGGRPPCLPRLPPPPRASSRPPRSPPTSWIGPSTATETARPRPPRLTPRRRCAGLWGGELHTPTAPPRQQAPSYCPAGAVAAADAGAAAQAVRPHAQ